jgi:hypothetical protein
MGTFVLALTLQCFFPIFQFTASQFLGISIVNAEAQAQDYVLTPRNADGKPILDAHIPISPANMAAVPLPELASLAASSPGWLQVVSPAADCRTYMTIGDAGFLVGIEPASSTATTLIAPYVEINTGFTEQNHIDTSIAVVNPIASVANVAVQLFAADGSLKSTAALTVPAQGSTFARLSELFGSALPANSAGGRRFSGYVRLNSSTALAAWERIEGVLSQSVLRAKSVDEMPRTAEADIPHFAVGGSYLSTLSILNPGSTTISLQLSAVNDSGSSVGERINVSLAPGEVLRDQVSSIFKFVTVASFPPPLITGSIRIRETSGQNFQLAGNVEISSLGPGGARESVLLSPISTAPQRSWIIPFGSSNGRYFTGYAIQNANEFLTVQTDVVVETVGNDGAIIDRAAIQLSPLARTARLMAPAGRPAYFRITANFPVHVLGAIGTTDGRTLEAIPAF